MVSIETKFIGPTNTLGARIKAYTSESSNLPGRYVTMGCHSTPGDASDAAALVLLRKLGWGGRWLKGHTGRGWVYVSVDLGTVAEKPPSIVEAGFLRQE